MERTWRRGHASELAEPGPHPRPALLLLAGRLSIFLSASAVSGGDNTDRPRGRGPARGCAEGAPETLGALAVMPCWSHLCSSPPRACFLFLGSFPFPGPVPSPFPSVVPFTGLGSLSSP